MITPKIYPWKREEIVEVIKQLASVREQFPEVEKMFSGDNEVELPSALIHLVARMIESVAFRLNRVPDKALLQLLSFADKNLILAEPARVPVKFIKAVRAEENPLIPRRTQVSTLTTDFCSPQIFEITDPLTVVDPDIKKFVVVDFNKSTYEDKSHCIETILQTPEKLFKTSKEFEYKLHLYHPILEEIDGDREYWLQVVLNFNNDYIGKKTSELIEISQLHNAEAFNKKYNDSFTDYELFEISLHFPELNGNRREQIIRNYRLNIFNQINNEISGKEMVYLIPVKVKEPIKETTVEGISSLNGSLTSLTRKFITVSLTIHNREYFNYFEAPELKNAHLRLFYLPQIITDTSFFITNNDSEDKKSMYEPKYEDVTNIEKAFCNDTEIDLSKPYYPFGKQPELNDTFYFSSRFFSCAGEVCEIDMWLLGDLNPIWISDKSTLPYIKEQVEEQKAESEEVTLGWEYFNGQEWVVFGKSTKTGSFFISNSTIPDIKIIDENKAPFAFIDSSDAFTSSACFKQYNSSKKKYPFIQFRIPNDIQKTEVNRINDWWLRVRILKGGYSRKEYKEISQDNKKYSYEITAWKPPIIRSFTINYTSGAERKPDINYYKGFPYQSSDIILTQNDFYANIHQMKGQLIALPSFPVMTFNNDYDLNEKNTECVLYIGLKGNKISGKHETLFFSIIPEQSMMMQDQTLTGSTIVNIAAMLTYNKMPIELQPELHWEYWSSKRNENETDIFRKSNGWQELQINDRTFDLTAAQSVEFTIPEDAQLRTMFNEELYWIRISVPRKNRKNELFYYTDSKTGEKHSYVETIPSYNDQIRIAGLNQNTVMAQSLVTINSEILGSSNGAPDQSFLFSSVPIAPDIMIMVREPSIPSESEIQNLTDEMISLQQLHKKQKVTREKRLELKSSIVDIRTNTSGEQEIWIRWIEVSDFLNSLPGSRHFVVNHSSGVVTFGNGEFGKVPDTGVNSIEVTEYRFGGSDIANITSGEIKSLVSSIPYIEGVTNIASAQGGRGIETQERVFDRGRRSLCCGNRAVTAGDYELLIQELSGGLLRTKAFSCRRPDGISEFGWTTIVAVINQKGSMPLPSIEFLKNLEDCISSYTNPCLINRLPQYNPPGIVQWASKDQNEYGNRQYFVQNVRIVPPNYIGTRIEADIEFDDKINRFDVIRDIKNRLDEFLHVTRGGPDRTGWEFGRDVYKGEIYKEIRTVPGVKIVRSAAIRANQIRIALPVGSIEGLNPGGIIPEGSVANITYKNHFKCLDNDCNFTFSFLTAQPLKNKEQNNHNEQNGNEELILIGFKEGDVVSVKGFFDVSHKLEFAGIQKPHIEQEIGRSRITGIEPIEYEEVQQTASGAEVRVLKYYRLYIEPMTLLIPGNAVELKERIYNVKNTLNDDQLLTIYMLRDVNPLSASPKVIQSCIKRFITAEGESFCKKNDRDYIQGKVQYFSSLKKETIVAVDISIPDFRESSKSWEQDFSVYVYPFGNSYQGSKVVITYDENRTAYDKAAKYYMLREYTDRAFMEYADIPYSMKHIIRTEQYEEPYTIENSFLNKTWETIEDTYNSDSFIWENSIEDIPEEQL